MRLRDKRAVEEWLLIIHTYVLEASDLDRGYGSEQTFLVMIVCPMFRALIRSIRPKENKKHEIVQVLGMN